MKAPNDKRLAEIAAELDVLYPGFSIERAIKIGGLIDEAVGDCRASWHWVKDNFNGSEKTAQHFVMLARNQNVVRDFIAMKSMKPTLLGIIKEIRARRRMREW